MHQSQGGDPIGKALVIITQVFLDIQNRTKSQKEADSKSFNLLLQTWDNLHRKITHIALYNIVVAEFGACSFFLCLI